MIKHLATKKSIQNKTPINIQNFGNTSGTSIPLLLTNEKIHKKNIMLIGFGVGMSLGNCIVDLNEASFGHS